MTKSLVTLTSMLGEVSHLQPPGSADRQFRLEYTATFHMPVSILEASHNPHSRITRCLAPELLKLIGFSAFAAVGLSSILVASALAACAPGDESQPSSTISSADLLNDEANRLFREGKLAEAAQTYRRALALAPRNAQFHFNLALVLAGIGDPKAERQELDCAIQLNPHLAPVHNQLGLLAVEGGDRESAEKEFKAAIAANPKYGEALNNLGVLYSHEGRGADAVAAFHRAVLTNPNSSSAYINFALALINQSGVSEAEKQLLAEIEKNPPSGAAYIALGVIRNQAKRGADAIAAFQKAVELEPQSADAHLDLGMALVLEFDRKDGLKELSEAVRLDPNSAGGHLSLGHFYFEAGQYDDARRELETAARLQPTLEDAYYFWALTEKQANHVREEAELLEKAVALNPHNADSQALLGGSLAKLGRTDEAIQHWKQSLAVDPNQSEALFSLARALRARHDREAQHYQDLFDELEKREQVSDRIRMLRSFALQSGKAQNWPQALEQLQQAIELCGPCSDAALLHKNLAFFYEQTGRIGDAESELEKTLAITPEDRKAQQALAQLRSLTGRER